MADVHSGATVAGEPVTSGGGAASMRAARGQSPARLEDQEHWPTECMSRVPTAGSAVHERARAGSRTEGREPVNERSSGPFGGLSPQEAGQRSAKSRREKRRQQALTSDQKVEAALRNKAEAGDVSAARELREWTRQQQPGVHNLNEDLISLLTIEQSTSWMGGLQPVGVDRDLALEHGEVEHAPRRLYVIPAAASERPFACEVPSRHWPGGLLIELELRRRTSHYLEDATRMPGLVPTATRRYGC